MPVSDRHKKEKQNKEVESVPGGIRSGFSERVTLGKRSKGGTMKDKDSWRKGKI